MTREASAAGGGRIDVVLGFSCTGKSTYIRHLLTEVPGFATARPVYEFMFRSGEVRGLAIGDVFHMDMSALPPAEAADGARSVEAHPLSERVFARCGDIRATVLVAPADVVRERIARRERVGIGFGQDAGPDPYPRDVKLAILDACPLETRYAAWFRFLDAKGVPVSILRGDREGYPRVSDVARALEIAAGRPPARPPAGRPLRGDAMGASRQDRARGDRAPGNRARRT
jgi:hypothetical protein